MRKADSPLWITGGIERDAFRPEVKPPVLLDAFTDVRLSRATNSSKVVFLTGIALDAFHDTFAADGAIIGNIIVHTTVLFRAEHTAGVHIATFVDVDNIAVARIEYQMTPSHCMHLSGQFDIIIPAE